MFFCWRGRQVKKAENDKVDPVDKPSYEELVTKVQQLENTIEEKIFIEDELRENVYLTRLLIDNVPDMIWA